VLNAERAGFVRNSARHQVTKDYSANFSQYLLRV